MPIYEYKCPSCNEVQEKLVRHSDPDKEHALCKCGGEAERIISLGSFELKGDWFKTTGKYG